MSSEAITQNDLREILTRTVGSVPSEYKKLLWTNPSPASSFSAQTISLNLSDYDCVEIEAYLSANGMTATRLTEVGKMGEVGGLGSAGDRYSRMANVSATGITFTEGKTNGTTNNASAIPYKIYGIKYERVAPPQVDASDYVIDQSTSGNWRYRKWSSGIIEAWYFGQNVAYSGVNTGIPLPTAYSGTYYCLTGDGILSGNAFSPLVNLWINSGGTVCISFAVSGSVMDRLSLYVVYK